MFLVKYFPVSVFFLFCSKLFLQQKLVENINVLLLEANLMTLFQSPVSSCLINAPNVQFLLFLFLYHPEEILFSS